MGPLRETYSHNQSIFRALAGLHSDSASDVLRSLVGHVARWTLPLPAIHCPDITSRSALQKRHHHQYHHHQYHHHYHLKYSVVIAW